MDIAFPTLVTFLVYLALMIGIGVATYRLTASLSDYVLGGRSLGPGVAALSAGASDMSGWLLLGLPGAIYASGLSSAWIAIGLTIGAYLNWQFVARRLRIYTEVASDSITVPDFLHNRFEDRTRLLRVLSALVILVFFAFYTSAGMVAGAKLFEATFGLDYTVALWGGGAIIVSYTFLGGFLAVAWTDFIQGMIMFFALLIAPALAITTQGGWSETVAQVGAIDVSYNNILSGMSLFSIVSLAAWGLGYFGQPHIIVRFMAMRDHRDAPTARLIGIAWMVISLFGAIAVGYTGIAYFADQPLADGEKVFILMSTALANPWVAGFLLAAILAAIMSTISSQLLVSSSALAEDIYKAFLRPKAAEAELVWVGRLGVLAIALIALLIAANPDSKVLDLVSYAWSGFGAAFGPVIIGALFWRRMTSVGALAGMLVGATTAIVWKPLSGGIFDMYEIVPGFIFCSLAIVLGSLATRPSQRVLDTFDTAAERWNAVGR